MIGNCNGVRPPAPAEPTPTPWYVIPPGHETECLCVQVGEDELYTTLEMKPEDAKLVVRAVNSHAKLLAACKLAVPEIASLHYVAGCVDDAISPEWRRLQRVKDALNEAIKLAEGDS